MFRITKLRITHINCNDNKKYKKNLSTRDSLYFTNTRKKLSSCKGGFPLNDIFRAKRHSAFAPIVSMCLLRNTSLAKCRFARKMSQRTNSIQYILLVRGEKRRNPIKTVKCKHVTKILCQQKKKINTAVTFLGRSDIIDSGTKF